MKKYIYIILKKIGVVFFHEHKERFHFTLKKYKECFLRPKKINFSHDQEQKILFNIEEK